MRCNTIHCSLSFFSFFSSITQFSNLSYHPAPSGCSALGACLCLSGTGAGCVRIWGLGCCCWYRPDRHTAPGPRQSSVSFPQQHPHQHHLHLSSSRLQSAAPALLCPASNPAARTASAVSNQPLQLLWGQTVIRACLYGDHMCFLAADKWQKANKSSSTQKALGCWTLLSFCLSCCNLLYCV